MEWAEMNNVNCPFFSRSLANAYFDLNGMSAHHADTNSSELLKAVEDDMVTTKVIAHTHSHSIAQQQKNHNMKQHKNTNEIKSVPYTHRERERYVYSFFFFISFCKWLLLSAEMICIFLVFLFLHLYSVHCYYILYGCCFGFFFSLVQFDSIPLFKSTIFYTLTAMLHMLITFI